jgi:hypothetical protein
MTKHFQTNLLRLKLGYLCMKTKSIFRYTLVGLVLSIITGSAATRLAAQRRSQTFEALASNSLALVTETEVGLEIEARCPGGSWARPGAEAAAILILVDGEYNQDLLLWAGDEFFRYRVLLGRLSKGKHTVSVVLNSARSAPQVQRGEIKELRPIPLVSNSESKYDDDDLFAFAHSPFLYARANTIDRFTDLPLLMYFEILHEGARDLIVRYTAIFTNEDGGTQTAALMARWGRATDIEWVLQLRVRDGKIIEETYQGVEHETKVFSGSRTNGRHPLLATASDNNNFSDLASSVVRFAPLPTRARLESATRESVMDAYPQSYRVMTEELIRERRISDTPANINTIADPREYLYIEASSEQKGAALAFDVKVTGQTNVFSSDMGEARLRIDRSGNFRTAVRLPKGASPSTVETVTARCYESTTPSEKSGCYNLRLLRVLMLDQAFIPHEIPFASLAASSLAAGEVKVFKR